MNSAGPTRYRQITDALMLTQTGMINASPLFQRAVLADGPYRPEFTYSDDLDIWLRINE